MKIFLLFFVLLCCNLLLFAQSPGEISGYVSSVEGGKLARVSVSLDGNTTLSDSNGFYQLFFSFIEKKYKVNFSLDGYRTLVREIEVISIKSQLNVSLYSDTIRLPSVTVKESVSENGYQPVAVSLSNRVPNMSQNFETLVKMLPGVSSHNELSAQYAVRGGNFDENLVYINGMEIYRPFLIKSGMHEGLSFINPDMVEKALFSAGGFEAKYGGKMSSVLAINYQQPDTNQVLASASLIGGSLTVKKTNQKKNAGFLIGLRHKANGLLLKTLDTKGDYQPSFTDVQTYFEYRPSEKWQFYALGNVNINRFGLRPESRETSFGTSENTLRLNVDFQGSESDRFDIGMLALGTKFAPTESLLLNFYASGFLFNERLKHDISGIYYLGEPDSEQLKVANHYQHSDNSLRAKFFNVGHRGKFISGNNTLEWGLRLQYESFRESLDEIDVVGVIDAESNNETPELFFPDTIQAKHNLYAHRVNAYIQNKILFASFPLQLNIGLRSAYWSVSKQLVLGPRLKVTYPIPEKQATAYLSTGLYHQPILYKALKLPNGMFSNNTRAQSSLHLIAGIEKQLKAWNTIFSFSAEIYYKYLYQLIPYQLDNLQIIYKANQRTNGHAIGLDIGLKGELVDGLQSILSLSLMQSAEKSIVHSDYLPRPTDQRFNLTLFLQDHFLNDPTYRIHLNAIFGSRLPTWAPNSNRSAANTFRIPAYRRLDIGFSKVMHIRQENKLRLKSLVAYAEIFNLFDINNTVSYLWIKDPQNQRYAVPWYLTGRQINIKLIAKF